MASGGVKVDKAFLVITVALIVAGFLIFSSASLGLLAREGSSYSSIAFSQTVLGLLLGTIAMFIATRVDFKIWKKSAFFIFLIAIILNILVLVPSIGLNTVVRGAGSW